MEKMEGNAAQNNEYILQKLIFEMFLISLCVIAVITAIIIYVETGDAGQLLPYMFLAGGTFVLIWIVKGAEYYIKVASGVVVIVEVIILPLFFIYEGGMFGPIPILVSVNIMLLFLFFKGSKLMILLLGMLTEYSYLLSRIYMYPDYVKVPNSRQETFYDYAFCFAAVVLWVLGVTAVQEISFIREKKRIESSNEIIRQAGNDRKRTFKGIYNEMRLPMNSIIGMTELLLKEEVDNNVRNEIIAIKNSAYDLLTTIDDVIIFSKLESGETILHQTQYHFDKLLEDIIESVSDEISNRNIHFVVRVDADIPRVLYGDCVRIGQIFMQLLLASISMTTEGRIILTIDFEKQEDTEEIILYCAVSDTGGGIVQTELDRGTEYRGELERVKLKYSVCKEFLLLMGGEFKTKGIKNVGTSVEFTIRNKVIDPKPMVALKRDEKPKVLVYVENDLKQKHWQDILSGLEADSSYVRNSFSFETAIQNAKYDFIFMFRTVYEKVSAIIAYYHCENNTYVVGDYKNVYGDFGKCRMIRFPLTCINVAEVLNREWHKEDYLIAHNQSSISVKGSSILVIDDSFVNLKIATGIFRKYGVDIDIAVSGKEGIKKIEKEHYDLILVDILMPEMNGEEVLHQIRQIEGEYYKTVPVIAVTSEAGDNLKDILMKKGFQEYLSKPIKIKQVEECMLKFLPEKFIIRKDNKAVSEMRNEEFVSEERGLNVSRGLSNIGNNEKSYIAILDTYYHENIKKLGRLQDIFKKEELGIFVSAVHGIKSASASIGAMGLSAFARALEYAGKDEDRGYISENLPLFIKEYKMMLDEIEKYLKERGELCEEEQEGPVLSDKEEKLTIEQLKELKDRMDRMDLKACGEIMDIIAVTNYGNEDNQYIKDMREAYEHFDFHMAKKILNSLITSRTD